MALKEDRRELDKLFKKTEREIKALMEFWENSFVDEKENSSLEIPWISKWHLGHPLDLNNECVREDPSYDEERVDQEALRDYLQELEEQRTSAAFKQAAGQKRDAAASSGVMEKSPALLGKLTICAKALASLSQGKPPVRKKPCVILSVVGEAEATREEPQKESGSPSSSREEEEDAVLLRKTPKRNLRSRASGTSKMRTSNPSGRSKQLQRHKQKESGHRRRNLQQSATDQSSEESEPSPSSTGERQPLKPYNFRHQSKQVSYVSRQEEEEEESPPEGNSEEDWMPEEEESTAEEEEDTEEMEEDKDEEVKRGEGLESDAGSVQAEPQKKNCSKTVRSYRCPECDREFSNSSNMRKHLRIHRGELPYGCHVCGKSYADPSNLTKHQLVHMGERRHTCPICPKAFYVKSHLHAHIRRHQGIRPFACLECRSTFCSRIDLLAHMKKTHVEKESRQPPVHCKDCDKTFARPRLLRQHLKRHKNLVCEDCGEVFAFKRKYRFHRKLRTIFGRCEVNYRGAHLSQQLSQNTKHPEHANQEPSASVPQGVVAKQPVGTPAHAGSQKEPAGSTQAVSQPSGTDGPSVSASSRLSTDGQGRPSALATIMSLKETSHLAWKDVGASQRNGQLLPVTCPVVDHQSAQPSTLAQTPLQLKLVGFLLQDVPVVWPVTLSPAVANSFARIPALAGPQGPIVLPPRSQDSVAFPVLAAAPAEIVPVVIQGLCSEDYRP